MDDSRLGIKIRVGKYEFIYFSTKTDVVGTQKNSLIETFFLAHITYVYTEG